MSLSKYDKHTGTYPTLTLDLVNNAYSVLKCNLPVDDQDDIDEHCEHIHGVAPASLNKELTIKVDAKIPFKLEPALNIENVGTDKHNSILNGWYTKGVATAVLSNTSNKANADLYQDRSGDFLKEVQASTSQTRPG